MLDAVRPTIAFGTNCDAHANTMKAAFGSVDGYSTLIGNMTITHVGLAIFEQGSTSHTDVVWFSVGSGISANVSSYPGWPIHLDYPGGTWWLLTIRDPFTDAPPVD